ncbi:MAG: CRISPR-associated protein Cas4 [Chloroflexi bacterium]|nr:CRISPR-associated protein Cas4 [Chloroflexota bacterium]
MSTLLSGLAALLLLAGAWLMLRSRRTWKETGLPLGEVIYVDTGDWHRSHRSLFSMRYRLTGKPDYLVEMEGRVIPVEVKHTQLNREDPYPSHKLQLAAYCLLVEEVLGGRPPYGILKYANTTLKVPYTDTLRAELLRTLDEIHQAQGRNEVLRHHEEPGRCQRCGFRHACGSQVLA